MEQTRRYELDGLILDIPLRYDERSGQYLEEYPDFIEHPMWTPAGSPVMFSGEEACPRAEEAEPGGCPDCGACRHYRRAGEYTLIGVCRHPDKRRNRGDPRRNE